MVEAISHSNESLIQTFRKYDLNQDGMIDNKEFVSAMASLNISMG